MTIPETTTTSDAEEPMRSSLYCLILVIVFGALCLAIGYRVGQRERHDYLGYVNGFYAGEHHAFEVLNSFDEETAIAIRNLPHHVLV